MRWCVLMVAALLPAAAGAQEPTGAPLPRPDASAAAPAEELAALPAEEGLLSDDALDDLVAPVALYPDVAVSDACVNCHNGNAESPRHDFKRGEVMGAVVIALPVE